MNDFPLPYRYESIENRKSARLLAPLAATLLLTACLADKAPGPAAQAGAPQSCDTTAVTYTAVIRPLYEANCNLPTCHNADDWDASGGSGIPLYDYASAKNETLNGQVVCAIEHTCGVPMPLSRPKLSDCQIAQVKAWVAKGCPE